uniref:Uncharacterized protein n=1 Tax=Salix viminalis TaxID=40686 RepID=A0A6N2M956_SALVM
MICSSPLYQKEQAMLKFVLYTRETKPNLSVYLNGGLILAHCLQIIIAALHYNSTKSSGGLNYSKQRRSQINRVLDRFHTVTAPISLLLQCISLKTPTKFHLQAPGQDSDETQQSTVMIRASDLMKLTRKCGPVPDLLADLSTSDWFLHAHSTSISTHKDWLSRVQSYSKDAWSGLILRMH